ncbi:MAG: hypothetical protein DRH10_02785 [Deltaproteobacteria bacterium]|nr:MAG: hypothetical protein DRH10_02785 [Deltaproteobacteria bacterium]
MAHEVEKRIKTLIEQGKSKEEIKNILSAEMETEAFDRFLRNYAELSRKESYFGLNLLLLLILAAVTFRRIGIMFAAVSRSGIDNLIIAAWSFLVPALNLYLLWLIHRFHRLGYMFLLLLSVLSLLRPENRTLIGLLQTLPLIVLSGFLYVKLFPEGGKV